MNNLAESLMRQDDYRARRIGRQIEHLDGLRERGFRHTEISIDAYEALLMENLSLQINQREHMKRYGELLAIQPIQPIQPIPPIMVRRGALSEQDLAGLKVDPGEHGVPV